MTAHLVIPRQNGRYAQELGQLPPRIRPMPKLFVYTPIFWL